MLINPGQYEITFVTPSRKDNGILKLNLRQVYASLPIRITVPRRSSATLPLNNPRVFVAGFAAKVHYGATCQCQNGVFEAIGLSTLVDSEGFREIRGSHMNNWVGFKEGLSDKQRNDGGMLMRASTSKTGIVEVRNVVFLVPGVYKIAFELQFESGELVGRTPWQTVEVQRVRKSNRCELTN